MDPIALMDFLGFSTGEIERMMLIAARLTGLFLTAPFFSRNVGPMRVRVVLLLSLTLVLYPLVPPWPQEGTGELGPIFFAVIGEIFIGTVIGMLAHWALVSVQVAGGIMGFQMGLSMAQVMDPTSGMQEGVLSNLLYLTVLMIFLSIDGHHLLLEGIAHSFTTLPIGGGLPRIDTILESGVTAMGQLFVIAILISAPVIAATKLLYLGMGLINRASPQVQVFFLAMPVAQMLGFLVMGLTMTIFGQVLIREMEGFIRAAFKLGGIS
ncbi:MAG: flagellar biosynthetic protein FliR [Magnetococcales bacterium]|nr:flagellar biosynthetic protein FliR [Magnetococcales bacterium]